MRLPWRRTPLHRAMPGVSVRRYLVTMILHRPDTGEVLMAEWMPPVVARLEYKDAYSVVQIRVSATASDKAAGYVRRQLERRGITPVRVEAR